MYASLIWEGVIAAGAQRRKLNKFFKKLARKQKNAKNARVSRDIIVLDLCHAALSLNDGAAGNLLPKYF